MIFQDAIEPIAPLRQAILNAYRMDEATCINQLIPLATFSSPALIHIKEVATRLVKGMQASKKKQGPMFKFLHQYDLSSEEGIVLMCLAEALLRIPDKATANKLIGDKIATADWLQHINKKNSLFVNAATWSLLITGKIFSPTLETQKSFSTTLKKLISRPGILLSRPFIFQGMRQLGKQFVMGTTIEKALNRAKSSEAKGYRYSYDMLGEAARTKEDAEKYFEAYVNAIKAIGSVASSQNPVKNPGISVKLSALHPRYELAKQDRVLKELAPRLSTLAHLAKENHIGMTIDAEEADRLDISLTVIEKVLSDPTLAGWEGFGIVVQAYQKRAPFVIDWLADIAKRYQRRLMIRLVKGAYWDSEIKISQLLGLEGYPVFTRKSSTDVSYLACAKKLFSYPDYFFPQFGTHNAYSVAAILELAGENRNFEFQCLHGMGQPLYDQIVDKSHFNIPCRIYAPVGSHQDLLGYLVRRLLENGANTSFVNRISDEEISMDTILADPVAKTAALTDKPHPNIPLPKHIFGHERLNSTGVDFSNMQTLHSLKNSMEAFEKESFESGPIIGGKLYTSAPARPVYSPADTSRLIGHSRHATPENVEEALTLSVQSARTWGTLSVEDRARCLERAAELFQENMPRLMTILSLEGGKHLPDCVSEIRETIDFCRYYAARAREDLTTKTLPGPTGELNQLALYPRGVVACISPWNFPLAIFTGQVVAALVCGNAVIAKPAEQTPLVAAEAVRILHKAGVPGDALHLLPGRGEVVGAALTADERVEGILFTGSTATAKFIQRALANREGAIVPLVAETGGQNAMIVDSSALPEQVVADVIQSAFNSAGQRCSALRVLFLQEDIAPRVLDMLKGAMAELTLGNPSLLETDIGPVIDQAAYDGLQAHATQMQQEATLLYQVPIPANLPQGHFFAPRAFILKDLSILKQEVFGPILHIITYAANDLDNVLDQIIDTQYGLTLGIHSRIDTTIQSIRDRMPVGNIYVNRNMIGAVVGVQPFGGERMSGTGPKAGGPHYLPKLCVERSVSINTTAAGGNATLVSLKEE